MEEHMRDELAKLGIEKRSTEAVDSSLNIETTKPTSCQNNEHTQ